MRILLSAIAFVVCAMTAQAQDLQTLLQDNAAQIAKPSRNSIGTVLDDMVATGLPQVPTFLEEWSDKNVWQNEETGIFFIATENDDTLTLTDIDSGAQTTAPADGFRQLKPNGGVRRVIGTALVQFQLIDPDTTRRAAALESIARRPEASQLAPLMASLDGEDDLDLLARKQNLITILSARFAETPQARIAAIETLAQETSVETRAVLNQILATQPGVAATLPDANIAAQHDPMTDPDTYYAALVDADFAPPLTTAADIRAAMEANITDGRVGNTPTAQLNTDAARAAAYATLAAAGTVPPLVGLPERDAALQSHVFFDTYTEDDASITAAARTALDRVESAVALAQTVDLGLDALSLASIYFLAAIGLAITFGVMGVINMAHGEFIMMGAYTGYVIQLFVPDYTIAILIALPTAFAITFAAGVTMERLVIRHLYHRPLETLLATFGISIALQQLAKNIFGTQARPLTSPAWLDGAWIISDVIQISYIRIAIFLLALIFLALILFVLKRTRLGLEVRAVTQNPGMAASMGINPDRINMLTFGFGSGIAGIAGVAIGLYAKVTSEMGADYIVQSFMTVVVGGVGNVWGTLAGASLIGGLQKGIEWFNPSNTLAAQTYMILFIILFIQFRPKGIVALKGRAAAD